MSVQSADLCLSKKPKDLEIRVKYEADDLERQLATALKRNDFDRSAELRDKIERLKRADAEAKQAAEKQRQHAEQSKLNTAFKRMSSETERRVVECASMTEKECEEKIRGMEASHRFEWEALEEEIAWRVKIAKLRFSPSLIAMKDAEARLISAQQFEEAKELHRRVLIQEERETARWKADLQRTMDAKRARLQEKQNGETNFMHQMMANLRVKGERARTHELELLAQRKRNFEKDMKHAHRMEMILQPDPSGTLVRANLSHRDKSSTYKGTLLLEKQTGSRFAIPSVCEIDELERTQGLDRSIRLA
eukprot:ANDGO_06699.mRNA.1 hypothetical protein PHYSODRAFT_509295